MTIVIILVDIRSVLFPPAVRRGRRFVSSLSVCLSVCVYIHVVTRSNSCKNVLLRGSISYFFASRSSQMNVEAANDVDPKC